MPSIRGLLIVPALLAASVHAAPTCPPGRPRLIIYHAGSLSAALKPVESLFEQRSGVCIVDVAGGSVQAARDVTDERLYTGMPKFRSNALLEWRVAAVPGAGAEPGLAVRREAAGQ